MIEFVNKAYAEFPHKKINKIYLTAMSCMNEIVLDHGGNDYRIPHLGKERLARQGLLPKALYMSDEALKLAGLIT